VFDFKAYSINK